jgi:hypothetical protein
VTLDYLVIDEAAFVAADRWYSELRPTLAVKNGGALFISTFDGENWFFDMYQRGQDAEQAEWESWRKVSSENPYFSDEELEEARRTTPKAEFEQEYMANPLVYVGAVFPGEDVQKATERGTKIERQDLPTFGGLDWGYSNPTALLINQETAEGAVQWLMERLWVAVELNVRCEAIADECEAYGVGVLACDAAGATEIRTLAETFKRRGIKTKIQPVPFGRFKQAGIDARRWYLETNSESIASECKTFISDTKRYRYKEGEDTVIKQDDHTVDAATSFYAMRSRRLAKAA